jgi:hypothetical protein
MYLSRPKFAMLAGFVAMSSFALAAGVGPCPTISHNTFQCDNQPYLTAGGACNVVITLTGTGQTIQVVNANPFDGSDETLVGFVNNSAAPVSQLTINGSGIAFWEGDGICVFAAGGLAGSTFTSGSSAYCTTAQLQGSDPSDYYGPNMTFSNYGSGNAVTINFSPAIPVGGSTFFSLEQAPSSALTVTPVSGPAGTPAPSSLYLAAIGAAALGGLYLYTRRNAA